MKYLKSSQVVPNKGTAWMLYELDDNEQITRIVTHIPETGEVIRYPKPKMKTLFQPERLQQATEHEFNYVWETPEE